MNRITYYGHSCFLVQTGSQTMLIDPFISANPRAENVNIAGIETSYIFLTHGHQDHILDVATIAENNKDCLVVSNFEVSNYFDAKGLQTIGLNHGGTWTNSYFSAKYVHAIHSSSFADGSYAGNPGGWVFKLTDDKILYMAGDTCLTMDMKLIPMLVGSVDLAILPVGGCFTMDVAEAVLAAQFVETREIIGCHYDTFPPIEIDHNQARTHFANNDLNLHLLEIGEVYEF